MFKNIKIGYILLISHILSSIIVGIIFKNWKKGKVYRGIFYKEEKEKQIGLRELGGILGAAITKSVGTILNIGGFIVIFSVVLSILEESSFFEIIEQLCSIIKIPENIGTGVFSGIIELTNGISKISSLNISNINIILTSFILGFGGISVFLQVYSIISESDISIKPYFYGKVLQAIISVCFTSIILTFLQ